MNVCLLFLQGSDGFLGALGAAGEKGKKVKKTTITIGFFSPNAKKSNFFDDTSCFCGIIQGPAGQAGGAGQRGANVSAS